MFQVKICGITRPADAAIAVEAGADAIGLNFYEKSPRCVTLAKAPEIAASALGAKIVGVFVNAAADAIAAAVEQVPLDAIQLHGDEPTELLGDLPAGVPIIRVLRMAEAGLAPAVKAMREADGMRRPYAALLVDAAGAAGEYGGTGRTADWRLLGEQRSQLGETPLLLAGGLNPGNVASAIAATGAVGVDTASGVESSPGIKDAALIGSFVANTRAALEIG